MLLPYTTLTYYGPAAGAMVDGADASGVLQDATPKGSLRSAVSVLGVADAPVFRPSRLKHAPMTVDALGVLLGATPKARARFAMTVQIGTLSQDDVTGAVLESEIESGLTLRQALRLIAAATAGKLAAGSGSSVAIRNVGDTKTRISAIVDTSGNRTAMSYDLT